MDIHFICTECKEGFILFDKATDHQQFLISEWYLWNKNDEYKVTEYQDGIKKSVLYHGVDKDRAIRIFNMARNFII